jgi:GTP1/Obg family GTP-binding protein
VQIIEEIKEDSMRKLKIGSKEFEQLLRKQGGRLWNLYKSKLDDLGEKNVLN